MTKINQELYEHGEGASTKPDEYMEDLTNIDYSKYREQLETYDENFIPAMMQTFETEELPEIEEALSPLKDLSKD